MKNYTTEMEKYTDFIDVLSKNFDKIFTIYVDKVKANPNSNE